MSVLSIVKIFPDDHNIHFFCLSRKTEVVLPNEFGTEGLKAVISNMFDTLYSYPSGVGLAANQVGVMKQICVIDFKRDGKKPIVCLNPTFQPISNELVLSNEQCLSFPNISVSLKRYKNISVTYQNMKGERNEIVLDGFKAIVFQHEIDHLNGKTFLDSSGLVQPYDYYSLRLAKKAMEVLKNE